MTTAGMTEKELRELAEALALASKIVLEALARLDGDPYEVKIDPRIAALEETERSKRQA